MLYADLLDFQTGTDIRIRIRRIVIRIRIRYTTIRIRIVVTKITSEEMVKERFISLFFPLTPLFVSVKTVSNIRARINNAWARRPRKRL